MSDHGLDGADRRSVGMCAEAPFKGGGFVAIVLLGARAVCVDIVDVIGINSSLSHGHPNGLGHLPTIGAQAGHVKCIGAGGVPRYLSIDRGSAAPRALEFL